MIGELTDKLALSATVPFPERMEGVDFGEVIGETDRKRFYRQVAKIALR